MALSDTDHLKKKTCFVCAGLHCTEAAQMKVLSTNFENCFWMHALLFAHAASVLQLEETVNAFT